MDDVDWAAAMKRRSDQDLLEAATSSGFEPAAVDAARAELARRDLSGERVQEIQADLSVLRDRETVRPDLPLSTVGRVAFVLLGVFFVWAIVVAVILRSRGYQRKSREAFVCIGLSFVLWGCLALAMSIFS